MPDRPRALIIGGSICGLLTAILLRRIDWEVIVFERSGGDLAGRGAGINTSPELLALMQRIGVGEDAFPGIETHLNRCLAGDGSLQLESTIAPSRFVTGWSNFYRPLRSALPESCYRPGVTCTAVASSADRVEAEFSDGSRATGNLLVAADGVQSSIRAQLLPHVRAAYAGYILWRFVLGEADVPPAARDLLAPAAILALPEREMAHCFLLPGADDDLRPGHRSYYIVWYRPADRVAALPDLFTDASGRNHGFTIPPNLVRPEHLRRVKDDALRVLPPQLADIVRRSNQPLLQAITDLESPRIRFDRIVLAGDAAFTARPHAAAGVTKAALDAACLVDSLAAAGRNIDAALAHYESERLLVGTRLVAWARELGGYLSAQTLPTAEREMLRFDRRPEVVLAPYRQTNIGSLSLVSPPFRGA